MTEPERRVTTPSNDDPAKPSAEELARAANPHYWTDFTVTFFVYTGDIASAHALAAELQNGGWESKALSLEDVEPLVVRGSRSLDGDHTVDSLAAFDDEMEMMAQRHGAEYDGSGVSIRHADD
jgi:hypothetical protein